MEVTEEKERKIKKTQNRKRRREENAKERRSRRLEAFTGSGSSAACASSG
jgi:hypothetical protein